MRFGIFTIKRKLGSPYTLYTDGHGVRKKSTCHFLQLVSFFKSSGQYWCQSLFYSNACRTIFCSRCKEIGYLFSLTVNPSHRSKLQCLSNPRSMKGVTFWYLFVYYTLYILGSICYFFTLLFLIYYFTCDSVQE